MLLSSFRVLPLVSLALVPTGRFIGIENEIKYTSLCGLIQPGIPLRVHTDDFQGMLQQQFLGNRLACECSSNNFIGNVALPCSDLMFEQSVHY